jgi:hypothetical protein
VRTGLVFCATLYAAHALLTVRLVLTSDSRAPVTIASARAAAARQVQTEARLTGPAAAVAPTPPSRLARPLVSFDPKATPSVSGRAVVLYAFFAPLTRTSVPTIAYARLFPENLPFFRLDVGLDILGFGSMPNDNRVVNTALWPQQGGGSVAVPFHFVLYSQGGTAIALIGSCLVGGLLGLLWGPLLRAHRPRPHLALAAGLVITFSWLIAIDSLRNNLLVSYGLLWGLIPVGLVALLSRRVPADPGADPS